MQISGFLKLQINLFVKTTFLQQFTAVLKNIKDFISTSFLRYNLNCAMARPFWLIYPQNLNSHGQLVLGKYSTVESRYNDPLKISLYHNYNYIKNLLH